VLSSMSKPPAHTNHCQLVAVAAGRADGNMSSSQPVNSTDHTCEGRSSGRLGLERLETGRMEQARDAHYVYGSVRVRATSDQHPPDAIFFAFLPSLS